nr:HAD-IIIC family phosphatase [Campylobacter sp.]
YDYDNMQHSGTPLSQKACLYLARFLGLKIIPSMILPNLKAIIVDLDNTLYQGILGEDGINNLKPNLDLQKYLKYLCKQGFLLCICSKNEIEDVKNMLTSRKDFILKNNDFTIIKANWNTKSQNIKEIANELNIGLDALLFIDDNIAEISEVKMNIPQIKTILAKDEQNTLNYLNLYPCLLKFNSNKEDKLRSKDIQANLQRHNLAKTMSKAEYFKELEIKLSFYLNNKAQIQRISELLNKTNQFILSYKRYTQTAVEKLLKDDCIITASMSDKLSDSGIIAIMICKKYEKTLILDELVVSCRALGRNIEDIMVLKMLNLAKDYLKTSNSTKIYYQQGPRNTPALLWLSKFANCDLKQNGILDLKIKNDFETFGLKMEIL